MYSDRSNSNQNIDNINNNKELIQRMSDVIYVTGEPNEGSMG